MIGYYLILILIDPDRFEEVSPLTGCAARYPDSGRCGRDVACHVSTKILLLTLTESTDPVSGGKALLTLPAKTRCIASLQRSLTGQRFAPAWEQRPT
jgi:hypothetical protein